MNKSDICTSASYGRRTIEKPWRLLELGVLGSGCPKFSRFVLFFHQCAIPTSSTPRPVSAGEAHKAAFSWGDGVPYAVVQEEMSGLASAFLFLIATSTVPVLPPVLAILQGRASCREIQARVPLLQGYQEQSEGKQVCGSPRASSKATQAGAPETRVSHTRTPLQSPGGAGAMGVVWSHQIWWRLYRYGGYSPS